MIINLDSLDYTTTELKAGGRTITVRSSLHPESIKAQAKFSAALDVLKEQGVSIYTEEDVAGVMVKTVTDQYKKLNAFLSAGMIDEWPFDEPMIDVLTDNQPVANAIQNMGRELANEFLKKKDN